MVQIPDNLRPYVDAVVKHHFWMLLGVVPVVILPMVAFARGRLAAEIDGARSQVESRLAAVKSVAGIEPHPNDAWSSEIDKATNRVKAETLSEWQKFWASQQPLRVWPASLGQDFVDRVAGLKPGSKLPRPLLERYQNGVRALVRTLPSRMGADEFMVQVDARATDRSARGREDDAARGKPAAPEKPSALLQWNPADQQRLYASFDWEKPPSTIQVLLAQEELWVYGVLADALARANKNSTGAFDAAVPFVETLAVGYPAAEDSPGGAVGGRIVMPVGRREEPQQQEGAEPSDPSMMEGGSGGGPGGGRALVRPPHPRFGGGEKAPPAEAGPFGEEAPAEAPASPDDLLRNWIYVDFNGRPLSGAEVTKSADARIVHLVPFVIRGVMDERRIDALLVDLATSSVPIDVRQVRINAGGGAAAGAVPGGRMRREMGMSSGGPEGGFGPPGAGVPSTDGRRPHDVTVELRGTVAVATPPDRRAVGLEAAAEEGSGDPAGQDAGAGAAEPAAAGAGGGDR